MLLQQPVNAIINEARDKVRDKGTIVNGESVKTPSMLRVSHLLLAAAVPVVGIALAWGAMRTQLDGVRDQQRQDEQEYVRKDRYDEAQEDIKARLERIERKLDEEKSLRELGEQYPKRHY